MPCRNVRHLDHGIWNVLFAVALDSTSSVPAAKFQWAFNSFGKTQVTIQLTARSLRVSTILYLPIP